MLLVSTVAIFLAASLLFCVQPLLARMLLPRLGGSPAVWTSAMLFFQAGLLLGYLLAHWFGLLGRRAPRVAISLHVVLAALAVLALPLALPAGEPQGRASLWVFAALAVAVGAPYVLLCTVSPLLQRWIASTDHRLSTDPYPLYAASNAGSLIGLLAYPFVAEPLLSLEQQRTWWSVGYVVLVATLGVSGVLLMRRTRPMRGEVTHAPAEAVSWPRRLAWVGLAMVPSSLMLGVTQHLSTDVAAAPLLWVLPLSLYLLTFIVAFGLRGSGLTRWTGRLSPIAVVGVAVAMLLHAQQPLWAVAGIHIGAFSLAALLCHLRLAALRPHAGRLTEFYLLVAFGGVLGGAFNALVAPAIFDHVLEYPLAIAAAMLALPGLPALRAMGARGMDTLAGQAALGVALAMGFVALLMAMVTFGLRPMSSTSGILERGVAIGLPALVLYLVHSKPMAMALSLCGVLVTATLWKGDVEALHVERTFFGVHTVERLRTEQRDGSIATFHQLRHGSTAHGLQRVDQPGVPVPLAYYHDQSPIAEVFALIDGQAAREPHHRLDRVALVGLGTGALASYGRRGMTIHAYEIDPAVVRIATNPLYFTFLSESPADSIEYFLGDGRLLLERFDGEPYDLIVLDAFSSDAIPVHLLTLEAFGSYLDKLAPGGVLAVHISNVYLDLEPVVAAAATRLGLHATMRVDLRDPQDSLRTGRYTSTWVMLSRSADDLAPLRQRSLWRAPIAREGFRMWTDDYSNILSVIGTPGGGGGGGYDR